MPGGAHRPSPHSHPRRPSRRPNAAGCEVDPGAECRGEPANCYLPPCSVVHRSNLSVERNECGLCPRAHLKHARPGSCPRIRDQALHGEQPIRSQSAALRVRSHTAAVRERGTGGARRRAPHNPRSFGHRLGCVLKAQPTGPAWVVLTGKRRVTRNRARPRRKTCRRRTARRPRCRPAA